jgi:hypothetical protein
LKAEYRFRRHDGMALGAHRTLFEVSAMTIDEDGVIETANPAAKQM